MKRLVRVGVFCLMWSVLAASRLPAEVVGGQAGALLKIGMDARALSMGSAVTALAQDASAGFWNPAGLYSTPRQEALLAYTRFPTGGDYSQLAYVLPSGAFAFPENERAGSLGKNTFGTVGIWILRYAAAYDIEARRTDSLNPDYLFADIQGAYGLAYGFALSSQWDGGVGIKGLYHDLDQAHALGFGTDVGLIWHGQPDLRVALVLQNAYARWQWSTGAEELFPPTVKIGAAYAWKPADGHAVIGSIESEWMPAAAAVRPKAGVEYGFAGMAFLRAGYQDTRFTYGGGMLLPQIGWAQAGLELNYAVLEDAFRGWEHWISLKLLI